MLRQLYESVIAPSFPPAEREPVEKLRRVLSADELRGAIAVMPDGVPVGALFLEWFADIRAALLCYFAVRPDLRGRGIGRRLIAVATPQWRAALNPHVVFAEAEDPRFRGPGSAAHADGGVDYGDGHARLRLYAGFDLRRLPIPYLLPELAPGAGRMPGLLLLVAEADDVVSPAPDRIRSTVVEEFLLRYFARQEGTAVGDEDRQLHQVLAECRRADFLPLLGISGR
jgi:GNAT superfamily N-acetyltransferase